MYGDIEPVTMNDAEHLLVIVLPLEVIATELLGDHRCLEGDWEEGFKRKSKKNESVGKEEDGKNR